LTRIFSNPCEIEPVVDKSKHQATEMDLTSYQAAKNLYTKLTQKLSWGNKNFRDLISSHTLDSLDKSLSILSVCLSARLFSLSFSRRDQFPFILQFALFYRMLLRILCLPVGIILLSSMILSLRISSSVGLISNSPVRTFQILSRRKELRHRSSSTGLLLHSNNLASKTITSKRQRSFSLTTSSRLFSTSSAASPPWPSTLLRFDGGSRGNPSPTSAWGFVAYEGVSSGEATDWCERGSRWGTMRDIVGDEKEEWTNNEAEYQALIEGLLWYSGLPSVPSVPPPLTLHLQGDSLLVVNQLSKKWKCKSKNLLPYLKSAQVLLDRIQTEQQTAVTIDWIPREENDRADEMANRGMDEGTGGKPWEGGGCCQL